MANSIDFILTNSATELIPKVLSGKTLNFTRMAVGDGFSYDSEVAKGYKALVNEVLSLDITKKEIYSPSSIKITSVLKNTDAQQEFYYREVGLYAQDPDTGEELLYAYGNRNDAAELITPAGNNVVTKQLIFIIAVGDSANVTFNVNADIYALQSDMLGVQANIEQIQTDLDQAQTDIQQSQADIQQAQTNITSLQSDKADKNLANTGMITNCLLEVPQDIKLELSNGTLTLKSGSKVYIPNGFESDGVTPKFDEVVTTKDCIGIPLVNEVVKYFMYCESIAWASENTIQYSTIFYTGDTTPTITTGPNYFWYNTAKNKIMTTSDGGVTWKESRVALPICRGTYATIEQIFNGMGYVGSIVFILPGVKGLIPNGRNPDGTIKNIEHTVSKIILKDFLGENHTGSAWYVAGYDDTLFNSGEGYFVSDDGYLIDKWSGAVAKAFVFADGERTNGVVTSFNPRRVLHAISMDDIDGKWVSSGFTLLSSVEFATNTTKTIDISSYLPNDKNTYEVLISIYANTGATIGDSCLVYATTDIITSRVCLGRVITRTSSSALCGSTTILPVGSKRTITILNSESAVGTSSIGAFLCGYRGVK